MHIHKECIACRPLYIKINITHRTRRAPYRIARAGLMVRAERASNPSDRSPALTAGNFNWRLRFQEAMQYLIKVSSLAYALRSLSARYWDVAHSKPRAYVSEAESCELRHVKCIKN